VICVALIVGFTLRVRVVEQSDRAELISNNDDGFAKHLLDLHDLIVVIVLVFDAFHARVGAESLAKPLELKPDVLGENFIVLELV